MGEAGANAPIVLYPQVSGGSAGVGYSLMQRVRKLIDNLKSFLSRIRDIETLKEKETFKAKVELIVVYY